MLAKRRQVRFDRSRFSARCITPHFTQQGRPRHHTSALANERGQQVELPRPNRQLLLAATYEARGQVDRQVADRDRLLHLAAARRSLEESLHASQNLEQPGGLHHVVVRAEPEPPKLLIFGAEGSHDENRHLPLRFTQPL